jgi:hypothetical protein
LPGTYFFEDCESSHLEPLGEKDEKAGLAT